MKWHDVGSRSVRSVDKEVVKVNYSKLPFL